MLTVKLLNIAGLAEAAINKAIDTPGLSLEEAADIADHLVAHCLSRSTCLADDLEREES